MDLEQSLRDMGSEILVDLDQVGVEGSVVDFDSGRRSMVPNPTEEPLPGTVKGMGIEVGIKARLRIRHRSEMPS